MTSEAIRHLGNPYGRRDYGWYCDVCDDGTTSTYRVGHREVTQHRDGTTSTATYCAIHSDQLMVPWSAWDRRRGP